MVLAYKKLDVYSIDTWGIWDALPFLRNSFWDCEW
jgi:hypothetical protein